MACLATSTTTTIDAGELPDGITVDANFQSRVFDTFSPTVLDGLTITHGESTASQLFDDTGAGGGIAAESDLTIENCTIIGNKELAPDPTDLNDLDTVGGGGISITGSANLTVINSTIASNSAVGEGGGIFQSRDDDGTVTVVNSTIFGNTTNGSGGGMCVELANLTNCTVVNNQAQFGGGIISVDFAPFLQNTIVAGNSASSSGPDVFYHGGALQATYSLIGNTSGTLSINGSNNITNPNYLGLSSSLGDNGGPTPTIALLPAIGNLPPSPAIGAGNVFLADVAYGTPTTDQRGLPRVVNGSVDIGAFQTQPDTTPPTSQVSGLAAAQTVSDTFNVTVNYDDPSGLAGSSVSGVSAVDLYVSDNGSSYSLYQTQSILPVGQGLGGASVSASPDWTATPTPSTASLTTPRAMSRRLFPAIRSAPMCTTLIRR